MGWVEPVGRRRVGDGWSKPTGYRGRTRLGGEIVSGPSLPTETQATRWWAAAELEYEEGTRVDPKRGLIPLREWADLWLESRGGLKARTRGGYESDLKLHIYPTLGDLPIAKITTMTVGRWARALSETPTKKAPNGLSAKSVHNVHGLLYSLFDAAVKAKRITSNPCEDTSLPRVERSEAMFLSRAEFDRLVAAAPERWRPLLTTMGGTGLRWGEVAGLRRSRVDLVTGHIHVVETLRDDGKLAPETPKSGMSRRQVSLAVEVRKALAPVVLATEADGYLFTNASGAPLRRGNWSRRVWKPAVMKAGLSPKLRPHDLRHTHAAWLVAAGVPLLAVSRRLGHESQRTTEQIYGHLVPAVDEAVLSALDVLSGHEIKPAAPPLPHEGDMGEGAGEAE